MDMAQQLIRGIRQMVETRHDEDSRRTRLGMGLEELPGASGFWGRSQRVKGVSTGVTVGGGEA